MPTESESESKSEPEPESSLPTQAVQLFHSSPPPSPNKRSFDEMVIAPKPKSEPNDSKEQEQAPSRTRASSVVTQRQTSPPSAQRAKAGEDNLDKDDGEGEEGSDPASAIEQFDWTDLAERYHQEISKCEDEEQQLAQEWESLMSFFKVWADAGHAHETERTYKRLRTRMSHVQRSEEQLEKTRLHYVKVVEAFESALSLLNNSFR